jgi:hypothetical protein
MSADTPEPILFVQRPALEQQPAIIDTGAASHVTRAATPEELRAVEVVFTGQERESAQVAALFGTWSAGMLLHDLFQDAFKARDEEAEREVEKKLGKDKK